MLIQEPRSFSKRVSIQGTSGKQITEFILRQNMDYSPPRIPSREPILCFDPEGYHSSLVTFAESLRRKKKKSLSRTSPITKKTLHECCDKWRSRFARVTLDSLTYSEYL